MGESQPWQKLQRARELEKILAEARARTLWGESPEGIREWLLAHEAQVPEQLARQMLRICWNEREHAVRRAGIRDSLIGVPLLVAGGTAFLICCRRLDAGLAIPDFAGAVAAVVPAVAGLLLSVRGLERIAFGARTEGEVKDSIV